MKPGYPGIEEIKPNLPNWKKPGLGKLGPFTISDGSGTTSKPGFRVWECTKLKANFLNFLRISENLELS